MNVRHGLILLGGALLLAAALAGCGPATPTPVQPTVSAPAPIAALQSPIQTPTPTSGPLYPTTASPTRLPLCTPPPPPRPEALQPDDAPSLEDYVFGEPQVVLTDTAPIDIIGWMPDGRSLLLARTVPDPPRRVIEALDTQTGRTVRYAETDPYASDVAFPLDRGRGVAFYDLGQQQPGDIVPPNDLMSSPGPGQVQSLVQRVSSRTMSIDPHSASLVRYERAPGGPPALLTQAQQDLRVLTLPVDPYLWKYPKYFPDRVETGYVGDEFRVAVRPDGSLVAFYADPYLFLYDTATKVPCEVDLGSSGFGEYRAPWNAAWSPDGRYLAMRTVMWFPGTWAISTDLTIYDTLTGDLKHINPSPDNGVSSFSWAPDSRALVVFGDETIDGWAVERLFLVNAHTGDYVALLSDQLFGTIWPGSAWAPSGQLFSAPCLGTTNEFQHMAVEDLKWQICLISVEAPGR